ncbi:unnamed protein product [Eruca vesicaria subsp. sativa]|uniref:Uncharacterized protein n=1 Tax=Eruca vesicaria subsp. sativa TaxID=29727 RepID=A0ABC8M0Y5_ERUVS|nr:unnamed protein product [Eruca vesicaria subsp. sativa]
MYSLILHRRRSLELQKCIPHLRVAAKQILFSAFSNNPFSSSATSAPEDGPRKDQNFTVSYLVDSLGFTTKLAESISRKVSSERKANPDSVLSLLKSHGFTDSQLSSIVTSYPQVLIADAESCLAPKLQFLKSRGASTSELTEILSKVPKILGLKKVKAFSLYYDFIKEVIVADKSSKLEKLSQSSLLESSRQENKLRNILVLRDLGVPQKLLFSLLMSNFQTVCGKERFQETLNKVLEMGFDPTTFKFVQALNAVYQLSDKTTQDKVSFLCTRLGFAVDQVWAMFRKNPSLLTLSENNILKSIEAFLSLGFTRDEFATLAKGHPQCLNYSPGMVKKKTEFLVKEMSWSLKALVSNPSVLGLSMEKRIVPRCKVIKALMSEGLLGTELPSIGSVLVCTNEMFLNKYVMKHDDDVDDKKLVAKLMAIFTGDLVS